jgi:hypothetical protein
MSVKYIGLDVHQATTVAAVLDAHGKLVMECIVETKASTLLDFVRGLRGELHVTLEVLWTSTKPTQPRAASTSPTADAPAALPPFATTRSVTTTFASTKLHPTRAFNPNSSSRNSKPANPSNSPSPTSAVPFVQEI